MSDLRKCQRCSGVEAIRVGQDAVLRIRGWSPREGVTWEHIDERWCNSVLGDSFLWQRRVVEKNRASD